MQLNIKITQSGFRLWFWPLTPGAFMSDKLRQLARGVIYGESEKVWKLSTTDTTHWHVSARLYIAQHWVQCSHSCSLHSSLQHLYFQARLLSTWRTPYTVLCDIRARNKVFRRACSQVILLNHQIEAAKARYDRARAVKRLSFRYSNRLKLTSLEGVRNLVYEFACVKCEEIEGLQAKLRELTGGVYDFEESDESDSDDQLSDC